jgi:type II secretory pathway pseudopilin PulG
MEQLSSSGRIALRKTVRPHRGDTGFTLIELMIAGAVLVTGVLAMSGLVALAVASNGHNRLDSTAVMLTQAVVEQVNTGLGYGSYKLNTAGDPASLTDCGTHTDQLNNPWTIESSVGGANLTSKGYIDFSQAKSTIPAGYQMDYVVCNGAAQATYDVRWNITPVTGYTRILTVGTRMEKGGFGPITFPINMQVLVGPDPS